MSTNYVYSIVLLIVFSAWFGQSTTKPSASTKSQSAGANKAMSKPVADAALLGIKSGEWLAEGECNIEYINGAPMSTTAHRLSNSTPLQLVGWALDVENGRLPESVIFHFKGNDNTNFFVSAITGIARPDVRDYFSVTETLSTAGYEANIDLSDLPVGEYDLTLIMSFIDAVYICDKGRKVSLK